MRWRVALALTSVTLTAISCLGPTEVVITISTNACRSLKFTNVWVNGQPVAQDAGTPACPSDPFATVQIGDLTILPGSAGIDGHVDIAVVGNLGDPCTSPDTTDLQCIVARRDIEFLPHHRLDLPIFLDTACAGFSCPSDQTCVVDSSGAHCQGSCTGDCPADGGSDDGGIGISFDASDAAVTCDPIDTTFGTPTFSWSFEQSLITTDLQDDQNHTPAPPFDSGASIASSPPAYGACRQYLTSSSSQALVTSTFVPKLQDSSIAIAFAFRNKLNTTTLLSLPSTNFSGGGMDIGIEASHLVVTFNPGALTTAKVFTSASGKMGNDLWHTFAMQLVTPAGAGNNATTTGSIWVDGVLTTITPSVVYSGGSVSGMNVGAVDGIDQIAFYAQ